MRRARTCSPSLALTPQTHARGPRGPSALPFGEGLRCARVMPISPGDNMAELVNLRRARKAKARVVHGRTKADKALEAAKTVLARKRLDAHKKDPNA